MHNNLHLFNTNTMIPILYMYVQFTLLNFSLNTCTRCTLCSNMCMKYDGNPTEIRSYIKNQCNLGIIAQLIFNEIQALYGDHAIYHIELLPGGQRNSGRVWRVWKITLGV